MRTALWVVIHTCRCVE